MSDQGTRADTRAYSARYGAQHPLLVAWPRLVVYLIWRTFLAVVRPALFVALFGGSVWFALNTAREVLVDPDQSLGLEQRFQRAFDGSLASVSNRRRVWVDAIEEALDAPPGRLPDLALAESYALAAFDIEGREALAMQRIADGRRRSAVEADLRGRTALERERVLETALLDIQAEGQSLALSPPELILAPRSVQVRLARARSLFGPALEEAQGWFGAPQGRAMALSALPGQSVDGAILYGDVRDVLVQGCALAEQTGRRVAQCRVGFLPKPRGDAILAGLSLAVLQASDSEKVGARLLKASWVSGRLDPTLAEQLALGPDRSLGREALLASIVSVLSEAGEAWSQPARFEQRLVQAAQEAAQSSRLDQDLRQHVFRALSQTRSYAGTFATLESVESVQTADNASRLARYAEAVGPRLHALADHDPMVFSDLLAGRSATQRIEPWRRWSDADKINLAVSIGLLGLAILLIAMTLFAGLRRRAGHPPGRLERLDRAATRLILGKNF